MVPKAVDAALRGKKRRGLQQAGKMARILYKSSKPAGSPRPKNVPIVMERSVHGKTVDQALFEGLAQGKRGRELEHAMSDAVVMRLANEGHTRISYRDLKFSHAMVSKVMETLSQNVPRPETLTMPKYRKDRHTWIGMRWSQGDRSVYVYTYEIPRENVGKKPDKILCIANVEPTEPGFVPQSPGGYITETGRRLDWGEVRGAMKHGKVYKVLGRVVFADHITKMEPTHLLMYYLKEARL